MKIEIDVPDEIEYEEVWLGTDGPFQFKVGKVAGMAAAYRKANHLSEEEAGYLLLDKQMEWLENGFTPEDWQYLNDRLDSADDPLDFPHLTQLFQQLFELASGRPTTSPRAASPQRPARPAPQDRLPRASASEVSTPEKSAT